MAEVDVSLFFVLHFYGLGLFKKDSFTHTENISSLIVKIEELQHLHNIPE